MVLWPHTEIQRQNKFRTGTRRELANGRAPQLQTPVITGEYQHKIRDAFREIVGWPLNACLFLFRIQRVWEDILVYLILSFYLPSSQLFRNVSHSKQHCSAIQEPVYGNLYFLWMKITLILLVLLSSILSRMSSLHLCSWSDLHCDRRAGSFCPLSFNDSYYYSLLTNTPVSMLEDRGTD